MAKRCRFILCRPASTTPASVRSIATGKIPAGCVIQALPMRTPCKASTCAPASKESCRPWKRPMRSSRRCASRREGPRKTWSFSASLAAATRIVSRWHGWKGRRFDKFMNPIDALFQKLRAQGRKAFIPFVTAGDPDLETTANLIRRLADCGASLIEIGFPYSDPIADGPVIQASYTRALDRGIHTDDILTCVRQVIAHQPTLATPLVMMVSYSIVHRRGPE